MDDRVTRRDYFDGSSYPPARAGMRGGHPSAIVVGHALRDGKRFDLDGLGVEERLDLVVVGAGISGLAAAWFYRRERPDATILLLDNHDDFGGHAKRNELVVDGRLLIGYGGSESLQSPNALYSDVAKGLLHSLGVEIERFETAFDRDLYPSLGLSRGVFFCREAFGSDVLVAGDPMRMVADDIAPDRMNERQLAEFVADFPVSAAAKAALIELSTSGRDPLAGRSRDEKAALLQTTSYRDYLKEYWGLDDVAADTFQGRSHDFFAAGIDRVSALEAMDTGYPGFAGLDLPADPELAAAMNEPYIYHFPDGNASLARLMVRSLIPAAAPGETMEDIVTARFDYGELNDPSAATRLSLESTVVSVRGDEVEVDIGYVHADRLHRVRAEHCVLAGYNMMIPSLMSGLPPAQQEALRSNVKAPIAYVNVAVRDWQAWVRLGVHEVTNPMGFFSRVKLDYPVSLGEYRCPRTPDEPMLLHLVHVPTVRDGGTLRERYRQSREQLLAMTFDDFERVVRDELGRMLGPGGFDADRDIAGIIVNRWGHGYSYSGDPLLGEEPGGAAPFEIARARVGNVAIANSDAAWNPFAHGAIDEGHRAVGDLLDVARASGA